MYLTFLFSIVLRLITAQRLTLGLKTEKSNKIKVRKLNGVEIDYQIHVQCGHYFLVRKKKTKNTVHNSNKTPLWLNGYVNECEQFRRDTPDSLVFKNMYCLE